MRDGVQQDPQQRGNSTRITSTAAAASYTPAECDAAAAGKHDESG